MTEKMNYFSHPELAKQVCSIIPESMESHEFDLAMALLMRKPIKVENGGVLMDHGNGQWVTFSPIYRDEDLIMVISNVGIVTGTHEEFDDPDDTNCERPTGYHYSTHAFFGGTSCDHEKSLKKAVAISCAKLLAHEVRIRLEK